MKNEMGTGNVKEELNLLFDEVESMLELYNQKLQSGEEVRLGNIDTKVQTICTMLVDLEREEAKEFKVRLQGVNERLKELSVVLTQHYEILKKEISSVNETSRAHSAYIKAGAGQQGESGEDE